MSKLPKVLIVGLTLVAATTAAAFFWLPVPECGPHAYTEPSVLLISPDAQYAYLSDRIAPRLLIVSLADNQLAANVPVPAAASDMALSHDGSKIYLLSTKADGMIFVVDAASRKAERSIELGGKPAGLAASADGSRLFTVQATSHKLVALDSGSGKLLASAAMECAACSMMLTPDGKSLIVGQTHGVTVFDAQTLAVLTKHEANEELTHFTLSPNGKALAYSFKGGNPGVRFLDLAGGNVETRATMGPAGELAFSADGTSVIASDAKLAQEQRGSLSIMSAHIPQEVKGAIVPSVPPDRSTTLTLDKFPHALVVDAERNRIDVLASPDHGLPTLEVLDGRTYKVVVQVPIPDAKTAWDKFIEWRANVLRPDSPGCR